MNPADFEELVGMRVAAELTGAPRTTVTKAVRTGELAAEKVASSYFVRVGDLLAWAKTRRGIGRPRGSRNL